MSNNFLEDAKKIIFRFENIIKNDESLDLTYLKNKSEIEDKYKAKISELDSRRKQRIANADAQYKDTMDKIQVCLNDLAEAENRIPEKYLKKYNTKILTPEIPDLNALYDLAIKINDWSVSGVFKRFAGISGYSSIEDMVNKYIDSVESAKLFLNEAIQAETGHQAKEKADAESEYIREKTIADQKKADYLNQIHQSYNQSENELYNKLIKIINSPELVQLDKNLTASLEQLGAFDESWNTYEPSSSFPDELMIGAIRIPFVIPSPVDKMLQEKMPVAYSSGRDFCIPLTIDMSKPLKLLINYEEQCKTTVMEGVQSIILKWIKAMPPYSFKIIYIDPKDRGSNLGKLQKLEEITSWDLCKKVYTSREDITKRLKELEKFIDDTSSQLAGVDSVYDYNLNNEQKIIHHLIIFNDYSVKTDRNIEESLEVLLNNAEKCGISMIFTSNRTQLELPNNGQNSFLKINSSTKGNDIFIDGKMYDFQFDNICSSCDIFIDKVASACNEYLKVDNNFANYFSLSTFNGYKESTRSLLIPFAVDSRKKLVELELGGPLSAHALLSGTTGSGKSTALHMIITSIILNYHPDDVELWLVDYNKVEFSEYITNMPPNIKLIGLEGGSEFTFSLLNKINDECQHRMELFKQVGVSDITEYKTKFGVRSLPRIIFIVDEFHKMTQDIQDSPEYILILENILSEYRKFGLSCLFSDQAISVGLRGLTDKGKKQIRTRLAMANDGTEIRETLSLSISYNDEELTNKMSQMKEGDVIFKRGITNSRGESQLIIDKYRSIFIDKPERIECTRFAKNNLDNNYMKENVLIIEGKDRKYRDDLAIEKYENLYGVPTPGNIPIYVGTPASLNPFYSFILKKRLDSNIMVVGADTEMRASIIMSTIHCFSRISDFEIIIIADINDELYKQYKAKIEDFACNKVHIITKIEDICTYVDGLLDDAKREQQPETLIVWLGAESIGEELSMQPEKIDKQLKQAKTKEGIDSLIDDIDLRIASFNKNFDTDKFDNNMMQESVQGLSYDARDDISELISKGPRFGIHNLVTYSSVKILNQARFIKPDYFEHKIALSMSRDDWSNYMERIPYINDIDNISAVYYDGGSKPHIFRPYLFQ